MSRLEIVVRLIEAEISGTGSTTQSGLLYIGESEIRRAIALADKITKLEQSTTYPS